MPKSCSSCGRHPRGDDYPSELTDLLRLPERVRALLYLVDVEGMRSNDAAELVGMSPPVGPCRVDAGPTTAPCGAECGVER